MMLRITGLVLKFYWKRLIFIKPELFIVIEKFNIFFDFVILINGNAVFKLRQ